MKIWNLVTILVTFCENLKFSDFFVYFFYENLKFSDFFWKYFGIFQKSLFCHYSIAHQKFVHCALVRNERILGAQWKCNKKVTFEKFQKNFKKVTKFQIFIEKVKKKVKKKVTKFQIFTEKGHQKVTKFQIFIEKCHHKSDFLH